MEINAISSFASSTAAVAVKPATVQPVTEAHVTSSDQATSTKKSSSLNVIQGGDNAQKSDSGDESKQLSESEVSKVTDQLNNFMESMNTDIKFVLHFRTNQLMIQVEEGKNHKMLKEFPAHELLDVVANMRDYVGALLDKKA